MKKLTLIALSVLLALAASSTRHGRWNTARQ